MKKIDANCSICGKPHLDKNAIGINIKLRGEKVKDFFCLDCLAENLCCEVQDILDKIEEFRNEGCKLFE
jgi:hypothetical protein